MLILVGSVPLRHACLLLVATSTTARCHCVHWEHGQQQGLKIVIDHRELYSKRLIVAIHPRSQRGEKASARTALAAVAFAAGLPADLAAGLAVSSPLTKTLLAAVVAVGRVGL